LRANGVDEGGGSGGARLGDSADARHDQPDDAEAVGGGEVAERVVIGDEDAAVFREYGDLGGDFLPERLKLSDVGGGVGGVGIGVGGVKRAERVADLQRPQLDVVGVEPDVRVAVPFLVIVIGGGVGFIARAVKPIEPAERLVGSWASSPAQ
jgi:hypothetical protein